MSAAALVIPQIWASAANGQSQKRSTQPELAFYRKYTEGMLRRYLRLSMEAGRVPSLLGKEMFRGKVTNYRVQSFDDVVIFVQDVETCLRRLGEPQRDLVERIAIQEYTQSEAANLLGLSLRNGRSQVRRCTR